MTQFLPPNLLALFAPRDPIPYLPPPDKLPHEKKNVHVYQGIAQFVVGNFEDPAETPPPTRVETKEERLERKKREKEEQVAYKQEQEVALWDPNSNPESTSDPFKTLFVSRINFYTSESKLRREFEQYGPIKSIKVINDKISEKPRGYCFIEFEQEKDMHSAYKHADGKKIDGRRVLVDVERARTVKGWLPRRLGGGLGGTRRGGPDVNVRHSGREEHRDRERGGGGGGSDRDRGDRRRRSRTRSRDRKRDRKRSRSRSPKRRRRSRTRSRDRKRSRSRDRKRDRKEKRSRSRDREDRRDRRRDRVKNEGGEFGVRIKDEPEDSEFFRQENDYDYDTAPQIKTEQLDNEDRKPFSANGANDMGY